MSERDANWLYVDGLVLEDEFLAEARRLSHELGVEPVAPAVGAQLAVIAAATSARTIIEIGTGTGVSGLWLLHGAPEGATLTTIDSELEHQRTARQVFADAGYPAKRVRFIAGSAASVLPRMNEASYDLVLVDGDLDRVAEDVDHALRLVRPGGTVLVAHALWKGRVSNPARRDDRAETFRALLARTAEDDTVHAAVNPAGDGLLQLVRRSH